MDKHLFMSHNWRVRTFEALKEGEFKVECQVPLDLLCLPEDGLADVAEVLHRRGGPILGQFGLARLVVLRQQVVNGVEADKLFRAVLTLSPASWITGVLTIIVFQLASSGASLFETNPDGSFFYSKLNTKTIRTCKSEKHRRSSQHTL